YSDAAMSLLLISPIVLVTSLDSFLGFQVLIPNNDEKAMLYSNIAGAVVNFSLNLILIPSIKHNASAISISVSETVVLAAQLILGRKYIKFRLFNMETVKYLAGSVVIAAIIILAKTLFHNPWIILMSALSASGLFYAVYLLAMRDIFARTVMTTVFSFLKPGKNG